MSSPTPTYSASVFPDILNYIIKYATGNDGCIQTMTASFQPSGQSVSGQIVSPSQTPNAGFFFQQVNVPQGVGVNIVFFSTIIPQGTFTITLSFTTTQGNTYQFVLINTLPPNQNYALVIIVELIFTAQPSQYVNIQSLLQALIAFASNQCQTQPPPQVSYSGSSFTVLYQYSYVTSASFGALLIAVNNSQSPSSLQVTVTMGGNAVVNTTISVPGSEYAYFLFTVSLVFSGE